MNQATISTTASVQKTGRASLSWSAKYLLADAAKAWNVSQRTILAMWAVPFIVALSAAATALISKDLYKWFTDEDRFAENMQVVFYSLALVLSLITTRRLWRGGDRWMTLAYLSATFGLFFLIGEELSWGQRIFGWQPPPWFGASNKQEETNIHNIYGVGATFKWIQLLVGAYGAILPFVVLRSTRLARYRETLSMLVPHYTLILYFLPLFIWRVFRNLMEVPEKYYFVVEQYNEVMELILAMGLFLFMLFQLRALRAKKAA